uniref:Uncharacterized protein n=1 Tax=Faecalibaculum rodentium TaxID=1702221 RepID=A0A140DX31_9FIRM|nr:hypothetical protein AALO17_20740 [Faecalibaculum rodentium]
MRKSFLLVRLTSITCSFSMFQLCSAAVLDSCRRYSAY